MFNIGYNKWEVLGRVREFATAYEYVTTGPQFQWYIPINDSSIMDLHNNCFGRTYAKVITGHSLVDRATNVPSQEQVKNDMLNHCNGQGVLRLGNGHYILSLVYNDFGALANANYFSNFATGAALYY